MRLLFCQLYHKNGKGNNPQTICGGIIGQRGVPIFYNHLLVYATAPMLALMAASFIAYRREGNVMAWPDLKNRFRLNKMDGKSWLWAIGLTLFMILSVGLLSFTARWLASFSLLAPPDY